MSKFEKINQSYSMPTSSSRERGSHTWHPKMYEFDSVFSRLINEISSLSSVGK